MEDNDGFPKVTGPPSIISSRMTDIASDDGRDEASELPYRSVTSATGARRSLGVTTDTTSRPGTGMSSRGGWSTATPLRKNVMAQQGKRGSMQGSIAGSIIARPASSASRSHVPSLTSHAFFHPMSSQKLQAQRGGPRPPAVSTLRQTPIQDDRLENADGARNRSIPTQMATLVQELGDDMYMRAPPSRGTEMTEQETLDRITANTSPTHGHYPAASVTDSVRPLQNKSTEHRELAVNMEKTKIYKNSINLPTPAKSPRSFRSSFLLPSRSGTPHNGSTRGMMAGAEKLSSVASSPALTPIETKIQSPQQYSRKLTRNRNYQYFDGSTVFCLKGRFQNTRSKPINIATGFFVLIPAAVFFVFSAPWLWNHVSPALPIAFAYIFYICMSSFLHASVSDPGVRIIYHISPNINTIR